MARILPLAVPLFLVACAGDQGVKAFNAEPEAEITSHSDSDEVLEGYTESFRGVVSDPDHAAEDLTATWYLDGEVVCESAAPDTDGFSLCDVLISATATEITLEVQDPGNAAGSDQISLTVVPTESPEAEITAPTEDGVYYSDQLITFEGVVSDGEDVATDLTATWESSLDGDLKVEAEPNDDGEVTGFGYLSEGEHAVQLNVTDTTGKTGGDSVIIDVGPPNSAPTCAITAPETNSADEAGATVLFEATVGDVDVPANWLTVTWSSDKDGELGESTPDSAGSVAFLYSDLSVESHVITLTVTDEVGADCSDYIIYSVGTPPEITIDAPVSGDVVDEGNTVSFSATVSDGEDTPTDLVLSWVSDIDGEFSTQGSDSTGTVLFNESALSVGTHAITATVTDTDGLFAQAILSLQINGIPTAPEVKLTPDPADTSDDVVVTITTDSTDADGDPITYSYAWSVDGVPSTASTSATLSSADTAKGQTWTVEVTPNDGYSDGPAGSDDLTIGNTAPVVSSVVIDPDPAVASDVLLCGYTFADDDGDSDDSTIAWTVNGTDAGSDTTLSGAFVFGDEVTCAVTANDGTDEGNTASATVTIDNTAPVLADVTLSPDPAYESDTLTCTPGDITDVDGTVGFDTTYAWGVNGVDIGESGTTLNGDHFNRGDEVVCIVTPGDGDDEGDAVASNTVTIGNTAPSISTVSISPTNPRPSDTLTCSYSGFSDVDGDSDNSTYTWTVDGAEVGTSATLSTGFTAADVVTCTVTPNDGDESGTALSDSVTIENTAPEIDAVTLSPSTVYTNDTLTASVSSSDADGDAVSVTYEWYVDGSLVAETGSTLDGSTYFDKGQEVYVVVTPSDAYGAGTAVTSSSIVVSNTAPGTPSISIAPTEPVAGEDDLLCQIDTDSSDDDEDSITYTVEWSVDGAVYTDATTTIESGDTVPAAALTSGDVWTCWVTPNDGDADGSTVSASVEVSDCFDGWVNVDNSLADADYAFVGEDADDHAGWDLTTAGDVDGDGLADVLISAAFQNASATDAGAVYVILAANLQGDATIDLADADHRFLGEASSNFLGWSVSSAGDVDGDGRDDILMGAYGHNSSTGKAYLFLGASLAENPSLAVTDADYVFTGENTGDFAGAAVGGGGDVDGDGLDDILIGAYGNDENGGNAGKTYLFFGASLGTDSTLSLSDADHEFIGENGNDFSGHAVTNAGDIDGDGFDDILIGAYGASDHGARTGRAYIVFSSSLGTSKQLDLWNADHIFIGESGDTYTAHKLAMAGDVDGDGLDDVLIGAAHSDQSASNAGEAYLLLGGSLGSTQQISLSDSDYQFYGVTTDDYSGAYVAGGGDVDGDGLSDILISGRDKAGANAGRGYLFLGASLGSDSEPSMGDADYTFEGEVTYDRASDGGMSLAGDVDGDGLDDLLISAMDNGDGGTHAGKVYLVFSASTCNTLPRGTAISIDPDEPIEAVDDLVCEIDDDAYDADGDSLSYSIEWEVDGVSYTDATTTTETGDTVPAEDIFAEEEWTCIVTPNDGVGNGAASRVMVTVDAASCLTGDSYGDGSDADGDGMDCAADCYDGSVYFAVCNGTGITWSEANDRCVAAGYDGLGSFDSAAEHSFAEGLASSAGFQYVRVGYNDLSSEGTFTWIDGNPSTWTNWRSGEPNNSSTPSGGEHCAQMESHTSYMWNDGYCDHMSIDGFVCSKR